MRWTRLCRRRTAHVRGLRRRVVPTPRRWRQVSREAPKACARRWWQSSIGSPRRARS